MWIFYFFKMPRKNTLQSHLITIFSAGICILREEFVWAIHLHVTCGKDVFAEAVHFYFVLLVFWNKDCMLLDECLVGISKYQIQ